MNHRHRGMHSEEYTLHFFELLPLGVAEEVILQLGVATEDDPRAGAHACDDRRGNSVFLHAREIRFAIHAAMCNGVTFRSAEIRYARAEVREGARPPTGANRRRRSENRSRALQH